MVKSMTAAIAGLKSHQTKMDVLGNNIANVNTWGYKSQTTNFQDAMYTNQISGSGGNNVQNGMGGVNTSQMGYGTVVGSISRNFETGSGQFTGNSLDCMIDGTGFFIVGSYNDSISTNLRESNTYLSRVGILRPDSNGYLVDDTGNYVYGYKTEMDPVTGEVSVIDKDFLYPIQIPLHDIQALDADGNLMYTDAAGHNIVVDPDNGGYYYIAQTEEPKTITPDKILYKCDYPDADGKMVRRNLDKVDDTTFTFTAVGGEKVYVEEGVEVKKHFYVGETDANGKPILNEDGSQKIGLELIADDPDNPTKYVYAYDTNKEYTGDVANVIALEKDEEGHTVEQAGTWAAGVPRYAYTAKEGMKVTVKLDGDIPEDGAPDITQSQKVELIYTEAGGHAVDPKNNTYVIQPGEKVKVDPDTVTTVSQTNPDGSPVRERYNIATWTIGTDGNIIGVDVNNETVSIGKIAVASVENPNGLEESSGYYYSIGSNAGECVAMETTGSTGEFKSNYLEMANVDLASDIATMITTQRGYQANTKIITVTDEMLEQLVNMKR